MKKNKLIIIVDDQDVTDYKEIMEEMGFSVIVIQKPRSVLEVAIKEKPILIFIDINMPKMDGYQVLQNIRGNRKTRNIRVIIFTANYDPQDQIRWRDLGADDFYVKGLPETICEKVNKWT